VSWGVVYYKDAAGNVPADDFLGDCPDKVEATILAVLEIVRDAPPPQFSGGGKWEAMHGSMGGYYEIRVTGPGRAQYRLFCILDNGTPAQLAARGFHEPKIAVITGVVKPTRTVLSDPEYKKYVRDLGDRYLATLPRPIAH
jgi:Txe/YoeB family toxin of Txe-Axe toxin-antitoxin module